MPTHQEIYEGHASEYEALVSREDYQGNILKALTEIVPLAGLDVVDLGTGTGRLACLIAGQVRTVLAFDLSQHMLRVAYDKLRRARQPRWMVAAADHRRLPLEARSADVLVSGWSVSYIAVWHPHNWRIELEAWLNEVRRVLRPNGHVVLFESLGTGTEHPQRLPHLEEFYGWLDAAEFSNKWIRTDYRFESPEIADELASFFFGEEMRSKISREQAITLPECTGVWWRQF